MLLSYYAVHMSFCLMPLLQIIRLLCTHWAHFTAATLAVACFWVLTCCLLFLFAYAKVLSSSCLGYRVFQSREACHHQVKGYQCTTTIMCSNECVMHAPDKEQGYITRAALGRILIHGATARLQLNWMHTIMPMIAVHCSAHQDLQGVNGQNWCGFQMNKERGILMQFQLQVPLPSLLLFLSIGLKTLW